MKIIHCADIHLDSAMSTNMITIRASERREELLKTWCDMVQYGVDNGVSIILIAGDWFDTANISVHTAEIIAGTIKKYSHIDFIYLPGNHDESACVDMLGKHHNLKVFGRDGDSFRYENLVVSKLGKKKNLLEGDINIVVAHDDMPDVKALEGRFIDYLALGHIHKHREGRIDTRGVWCYSGCLEARGYDESGMQGFVLLETKEGQDAGLTYDYIPFGYRHVHEIDVKVACDSGESGMDTIMICDKIAKELEGIPGKDMVKVRLKGELEPGTTINTSYINSYFRDKFYGFRGEDCTAMVLDIVAISKERSLKGEFIRAVMASDETDDMKRLIIRCGLSALIGEVTE